MFQHEREDAKQHNWDIITAKVVQGTFDPLEWLKVPLSELSHPDIVVGDGLKLGVPACCIVRSLETAASGCRLCMFFMKTLENTRKLKDQVQSKRLTRKSRKQNYNFAKRLIQL